MSEQTTKLFGRTYNNIGNSNSDLILKTRGQVKVQWGSKFIDLIKDGKINTDCKIIYKEDSVGVKDGIYIINGEKVVLKVGETELDLAGAEGTTYVSFQNKQETTPEQKYTALTNIGFIYKNLDEVQEDSLQNGIIYVESEQKLYIIQEGSISEFTTDIPNPYNKQFTIKKSDSNIGSLVIKGNGKENSLAFDSLYIYNDGDSRSHIESTNNLFISIGDKNTLELGIDNSTFNSNVISSKFQSYNANSSSGFRLYYKNNESTLEVDNLIVRNSSDNDRILSNENWWSQTNLILNAIDDVNIDNDASNIYKLQLKYQSKFNEKDIISVYINKTQEDENTGDIYYTRLRADFKVISSSEYQVEVELINTDLGNIFQYLSNKQVYLTSSESKINLIKQSINNLDIIESSNLEETIITRIGDLSEIVNEEKYGIYSNEAIFDNIQYSNNYSLPIKDNSTKLASTEWVNNLLPQQSIIMYNGVSAPDGWKICDGSDGTPDLSDKFINLEDGNKIIYIIRV